MKKKNLFLMALFALSLAMVFNACKKDDDDDTPADITGDALFSFVTDGKTVTFTNESTVSGTVTYAWDFGDENTSAEENPVHTYELKGEYTVTLTVLDTQGGTHPVSTKVKVDKKTRISLTDNSFDDWDAVTGDAFVVPQGDNSGAVVSAKYDYDANFIYAYAKFEGDITLEYQYDMMFDYDNDSTTGFKSYLWPSSGAEFLPEVWAFTTEPVINFYNYIGAPGEEDWNWEEVQLAANAMILGTIIQDGNYIIMELGFDRGKIEGLENDIVSLGAFISDAGWAEIGFIPDATIEGGENQGYFVLDMR